MITGKTILVGLWADTPYVLEQLHYTCDSSCKIVAFYPDDKKYLLRKIKNLQIKGNCNNIDIIRFDLDSIKDEDVSNAPKLYADFLEVYLKGITLDKSYLYISDMEHVEIKPITTVLEKYGISIVKSVLDIGGVDYRELNKMYP